VSETPAQDGGSEDEDLGEDAAAAARAAMAAALAQARMAGQAHSQETEPAADPPGKTAGSGVRTAPGSGVRTAPGSGVRTAPGSGVRKAPGSGVRKAPGSGVRKAPGSGVRKAPGSGVRKAPAVKRQPRTGRRRPTRGAPRRSTRRPTAAQRTDRPPRTKGGSRELRRFDDLGWKVNDQKGTRTISVDVGAEVMCVTRFEGDDYTAAKDEAHPTLVIARDPHALRSLEAFSLDYGLPALERWPATEVLRGTHGSLAMPSQIGLLEFPATHVLSGAINKIRTQAKRQHRELAVTLPTFFPTELDRRVRRVVSPRRKGGFVGVQGPIAAAYFYLAPALDLVKDDAPLPRFSREALKAGELLVLDWGASGLEYGLVAVRSNKAGTELRLVLAGVWPSLGGHRLTLEIYQALKKALVDKIVEAGPSDELVRRPLFDRARAKAGEIPRPPGYEEAFEVLQFLGNGPLPSHEHARREQLRNIVFPTIWRYPPGDEPVGFAPYRKLAIQHFKVLWAGAERLKRLILSAPQKHLQRKTISWNLEALDSPFSGEIYESALQFPVKPFLETLQERLRLAAGHIRERLHSVGREQVPVAYAGMQSASALLDEAVVGPKAPPFCSTLAPPSSDPLELKSVVNRGAALLNRDRKVVDLGPPVDVLPFNILIADCLGNVLVFAAGPIDELVVFQRRIRVEEGFPRFEFYLYESEDGTVRGTWGATDFQKPFEFTERDRVFAVDPRYGFGRELPQLSALRPDKGANLHKQFFDRGTPGHDSGLINFRNFAPRKDPKARNFLHFLEYGLQGEFHRKVCLLEREFKAPPRRFDYIWQRYYLSRSQELIVVREWWAPRDGKLVLHRTLHTCHGQTESNTILGLDWGTY